MARARNAAGGGRLRIEAETLDVRKDEDAPQLVAYVFGQNGRLLDRNDLDNGKGSLPAPSLKQPESLRVVVGPPIDAEDDGELLAALTRLDAPELQLRSDEIKEALHFPIDRYLWRCWFRFCTVRGKLLKRVFTGGLHVDLPVCDAEIEIYEVDPLPILLPKIPDIVLERIRDLVRRPWPPPPPPEERFPGGLPFPPTPPGPGPDPGPLLEGGGLGSRMPASAIRSEIGIAPVREELRLLMAELQGAEGGDIGFVPTKAELEAKDGEQEVREFQVAAEESIVTEEEAAASVQALAAEPAVRSAAASGLGAFRTALLANPQLVRPLLCWIWPLAVTTQLVARTTTDDCGKFRARVYVGCSTDQPDLYFKAYRRIGFFRIPIHAPTPIACHTWWDYVCGTEVVLVTTSAWAHTCPPCQPVIAPGHWVLAMAVGNLSMAGIHGIGAPSMPSDKGLTTLASGWGEGSPFGGDLRLRLEFDNTLLPDLNVKYYRVRWRKAGSGNPWKELDHDERRHYAHVIGMFNLVIDPYLLGPHTVNGNPGLYEIPPALPPLGQWAIADAVEDTTSARFASASFAGLPADAGLHEFELTLFDAAGNPVNANTAGISYRIPTTLNLNATITTASAGSFGLVTASGRLIFQLYVDNSHCFAWIDPPTLGGSAAADACGLLRYTSGSDAMTLPYTASHPHTFATYAFNVHRGVTHIPAVSTPSPPGWLPVGPPPGTHVVPTTAGALLGGCTIAGFAETLYVAATATNGWSRQSQYDDSKVRAFALAPQGA
jgi:hypothetical protein